MKHHVSAYFLNAFTGYLSAFSLPVEHHTTIIKKRINCQLFDIVQVDDGLDLFIDDEGLHDGLATIAEFKGNPTLLAGNLVFVGRDQEGNLADPRITIEELAERLFIKRPVLDPQLEFFATSNAAGTRLTGFRVRIEEANPIIVADGEA